MPSAVCKKWCCCSLMCLLSVFCCCFFFFGWFLESQFLFSIHWPWISFGPALYAICSACCNAVPFFSIYYRWQNYYNFLFYFLCRSCFFSVCVCVNISLGKYLPWAFRCNVSFFLKKRRRILRRSIFFSFVFFRVTNKWMNERTLQITYINTQLPHFSRYSFTLGHFKLAGKWTQTYTACSAANTHTSKSNRRKIWILHTAPHRST